ncbi:hypothetical protein H9Q10_03840 [Eikenella sp. S3360]|uniref:Uncharacterized protein n=1 Tax=Eikenella glucosivorans TaxID=2766967 RepID=A0ABS0N924_9NEIS|nr:hypothetical protein [Eikenella glucosivorans]MBH5328798.1 hypothetical protein [Eikenella glucosivorans]
MKKMMLATLLLVCGGTALAQQYGSEQQIQRLRGETAQLLKTAPRASDRALIEQYKLENLEGNIWEGLYAQGDSQPSTAPSGYFLLNRRGLQAYIGWDKLDGVRCRPVNGYRNAQLCTAPRADQRAVRAFERRIAAFLKTAG